MTFSRLTWPAPCLGSLLIVTFMTCAAVGQEEGEEAIEPGIRDNSFLVEEAFNQEQGVVQHIFNFVPGWERDNGHSNTFDFVFTQEWPVGSQRHQFSYTLPMSYLYEQNPDEPVFEGQGFGDLMLNYRFQALDGNLGGWWAAPRFSVILPTGDERDRLGNGEVGYQLNLPFSKEFDRWTTHLNAGATWIPNVTAGLDPQIAPFVGQDMNGYHLGASAIYFLRPHFHLMLETIALWEDELAPDGREDHTFQLLLNPGFRWAAFTEDDTQWVLGLGVPIGLTRDSPDFAVFAYMSFEHRVVRNRGG